METVLAALPSPSPATPPAPPETTTPTRRIRYAVIGLGHIAQVAVLPGFGQARHSELRALVSGDREKLKELKKRHRVPRTFRYEKFDECLADPDLDAVYIALPNDLHLDCVLRAAAAGKHILCEKPLALRSADVRLMARAAANHGVKLMTAYRLHFEPATLSALETIRSGRLGEIRYFSATFSYQLTDTDNIRLSAERGGGPVYDIGIYCINAARMMMEAEPEEVSAMVACSDDRRFGEVEETAGALLRFPGGRLATFVVSFGADTASRFEVVGTKGRLVLEPAFEYSEALKQTLTIDGKAEEKTFPHTDQFAGEIDAFSQCILNDETPELSAEEALGDVRVIEAILASAERGVAIRLKPFERSARAQASQAKKKPAANPPEPVKADSPHD